MRISLSGGKSIDIDVERKRVKRITLRIYPDGAARVSAPFFSSGGSIKNFVESKKNWIEKCLDKRAEAANRKENTIRILGVEHDIVERRGGAESVEIERGRLVLTGRAGADHQKTLSNWWLKSAENYYNMLADKWVGRLAGEGIARPRIRVRKMKTRWGSCTCEKGDIRLNYYLFSTPPRCVDYVVLHEIAHLRHPNHGEGFKAFMTKYMPDWKNIRKELKCYSTIEPW